MRNLERHEAQLLGFMGKAQKVADLISLEGELARVRGEIDGLAAVAAQLSPMALSAVLGWVLYRRFRRQPEAGGVTPA